MDYEFKNLNEVPHQDKPTKNTTVMAFDGGVPKQIPANEFGRNVVIIDADDENTFNWDTMECTVNYDPIYETLENGGTVLIKWTETSNDNPTKCTSQLIFWVLGPGVLTCFTADGQVVFTNGTYTTATEAPM